MKKEHKKKHRHQVEALDVTVKKEPIIVDDGIELDPYQLGMYNAVQTLLENNNLTTRGFDAITNNGWCISDSSDYRDEYDIQEVKDSRFGGMIPGVAYAFNNDLSMYKNAPCIICNTMGGMVYCAPREDDTIKVLAPVVNPCVIGHDKPEALLVPLTYGKAPVIAAIDMLDSVVHANMYSDEESEKDEDECCSCATDGECTCKKGLSW